MLSVGRLTTHRYQRAGTGIRDRPSQGPTLGKHLLQATSSWAQAPSAHQRSGWILRTPGRRASVHRRAGGLCFGATWLCHYYRLPTTEADRDATPRPNLNGVPNEGWTPVAPALYTVLSSLPFWGSGSPPEVVRVLTMRIVRRLAGERDRGGGGLPHALFFTNDNKCKENEERGWPLSGLKQASDHDPDRGLQRGWAS
jgi:hypothetical protein